MKNLESISLVVISGVVGGLIGGFAAVWRKPLLAAFSRVLRSLRLSALLVVAGLLELWFFVAAADPLVVSTTGQVLAGTIGSFAVATGIVGMVVATLGLCSRSRGR